MQNDRRNNLIKVDALSFRFKIGGIVVLKMQSKCGVSALPRSSKSSGLHRRKRPNGRINLANTGHTNEHDWLKETLWSAPVACWLEAADRASNPTPVTDRIPYRYRHAITPSLSLALQVRADRLYEPSKLSGPWSWVKKTAPLQPQS